MADSLNPTVAAVADELDAIDDPIERYEESRKVEAALADELRGVRQRIALELKKGGRTWREIGVIMGDVTPQRAEQISRGV